MTNQDLQWQLFFKAIKISDGIDGNKIWKIWEEYLEKEYNFNFKDNLIELTFGESKNKKLVEIAGKKCDTLDDGFWVRSRSYWCQRLLKTKDKRFEERAVGYGDNDVNILLMLLDFYKSKNKLDRVIELAWPKRGQFQVSDWLVKNLNANEYYEKLMILREERLTRLFNKEDLCQLRELYRKYKSSEWEQITERLIKNTSDRHSLIDLAMVLGRYDLAVTVLATTLDYPPVDIDGYANKLAVLDTNSGIKLYRLLVEREIGKIRNSNYYKNFWHYIDELRRLKDKKIVDVLRLLLMEYPAKTKLIEGIKQRLNNL